MHPFPYIKELCNLDEIKGFNDVVKIMSMVYTTVPWIEKPYTDTINMNNIEDVYNRFKNLEIGGWCGLNAEFFKWILEGYRYKQGDRFNIRYKSYNFGLSYSLLDNRGFTHIGILVEIDGMEYFFDPYFARYYIHVDGYPLQFHNLINLIRDKKFDRYDSKFLDIKKPIVMGDLTYWSPQELYKFSINYFEQYGLKKISQSIFGSDNFDNLMLIKIAD